MTRLAPILILIYVAFALPVGAQTSVYRCTVNGVATFADRPCDGSAKTVSVESEHVSIYDAPEITARPAKPASTRRKARNRDAPDAEQRDEQCARISERIEAIEAKQRAGYRASAGIRMDERRRTLRAKARALKCS